MTGRVLILGASGRFGRNAADAFWNAGWQVRRFERGTDDLDTSAKGCDLIVNGWNPSYPDWASQIPALTRQVIQAAQKSGATVAIPGNIYGYGPDAPEQLAADTPHRAQNPLGRIRIDMENAYREAGIRTIILRAGDFLDTEASGNWFDKIMIGQLHKGRLIYPGRGDIAHAWAYLPDMARALVELAEMRDQLADFEDVPFPGYRLSGQDMAVALGKVLNRPISLRQMSWLPLHILRPVWPMAGKLLEMRYLWDKPHWLDNHRFDELLPGFTATAPTAALALAIKHKVDPDQTVARGTFARDQIA